MIRFNKSEQLGLSLIELLVSMVVGFFIIAGISSVYIDSKRSSITNNELSLLQESGRLTLQILSETIQHTSYTSTSTIPFSDMFIRDSVSSASCSDGTESVLDPNLFSPLENNTGNGDTIGVAYMGDDKLNIDCLGKGLPEGCRLGSPSPVAASIIYSYFKVQNLDDVPTLMCISSLADSPQEIAEGVENIQFTYGEDVNADGIADRYVNSSDVVNWGSVVSVNIAVLIRSLSPVALSNTPRSYKLSEDTTVTRNDKFLRAVFTSTVRLRNVL